MNGYIIYIGYVHIAQLSSILFSAVGLILLLCSIQRILYNEVAFAIVIGASAYAVKTAAGAVTVMQDLIWQKAIFDDWVTSQGGGKIIHFDRGGDTR